MNQKKENEDAGVADAGSRRVDVTNAGSETRVL